jgi:predicted amidohydrolase YtcJ
MKKIIFIFVISFLFSACQKEKVDTIVINSTTYTVNDSFEIAEAFAIKDGKFVAVGSNA